MSTLGNAVLSADRSFGAIDVDAAYVLSGDSDGHLVVWDRVRLASIREFLVSAHHFMFKSWPDCICSACCTTVVFAVAIKAHSESITSIRMTPNGEILTACLDNSSKVHSARFLS